MSQAFVPEVDLESKLRRRTVVVGYVLAIVVTLGLVSVMARVAMLRWMPNAPLLEQATHRYTTIPLYGRRGAVTDRNGRFMAVTRVGYKLFVDPGIIQDFSEFSARLGYAIGVDPAIIDQKIGMNADKRYVVIDKLLDDDQARKVRELNLRGAALDPRPVRHYAAGNLAGQVLGFVGAEYSGQEGIELAFEQVLQSADGKLRYLRDARHRPLWVNEQDYTPPVHGQDVKLSLDLVVQEIAQEELMVTVDKYKPKAAQVVVMDARDGQLLSLVNWPFYDPRDRGNASPDLRRNRCATDTFEPGSIFKPYVHSAITEAGVALPNENIDVTTSGAWRTPFGRVLHDAHGHADGPWFSWDKVLIKSSNIGMGRKGLQLGERRMHDAVRRFGFGSETGSGLIGEVAGIVNPLEKWNKYSITSVPMGQEIAVTPLQMVRAFSAFCNSGKMVQPSILAKDSGQPRFTQALTPVTADHTRDVLRLVVTEGTGKKSDSKMYEIFGKTGTAQVPAPDRRGYLPRAYTGSFICGAPFNNPRIIVIVVIHQPDPAKGYYGGIVAGPVAMNIVERTLPYLGIPPKTFDHSQLAGR